jgi:endonuclease YncB( thermonuclease family)
MISVLLFAAAYVVPAGQPFACRVTGAYDADGPIYCQRDDGRRIKIRVQGVGAVEANGTCRAGQPCGIRDPKRARALTLALVQGKRLDCISHGHGLGDRTAGWCTLPDGKSLSCEIIRSGAGARWPRYDPEGLLRDCAFRRPGNHVRDQRRR